MTTQIVAVRSLLIDAVAELAALADVEVTFGYRPNSKRRERVWTQRAELEESTVAARRAERTIRDESATFEVVVWVEGIGQDALWTAGRAVEIGAEVEEWVDVHANWTGALPGLKWITVSGRGSLTEAYADKGTLAELVLPVSYQARID